MRPFQRLITHLKKREKSTFDTPELVTEFEKKTLTPNRIYIVIYILRFFKLGDKFRGQMDFSQ